VTEAPQRLDAACILSVERNFESHVLSRKIEGRDSGIRGAAGTHAVSKRELDDSTKEKIKLERPPEPAVPAIDGGLNADGKRFAIVVSRFNSFITERLFQSAYDGLLRSGAKKKDIVLARVPGAFEIPSAARMLAETQKVRRDPLYWLSVAWRHGALRCDRE
jgi:hypothetical protein